MGLDVGNDLFGNFHVNWAGTRWFRTWCQDEGLPDPFIGRLFFGDRAAFFVGKNSLILEDLQRFFHTYGFAVQRTDEVELLRIDDITLEQTLLERMFDVGTLVIESTDKSEPRKLSKAARS